MDQGRLRDQRGFTLVEMVMVVGIMAVTIGMVALVSPAMSRYARAESGIEQALSIFRQAREIAVGQRRNMQIRFLGDNVMQIVRVDIPNGTTVLHTQQFESRMQFHLMPGLPDTPDQFGNATATAFGPSPARMFTSEGSFVDQNGDELNGTLFLGIPGQPETARAISVFGPTALLRTWRWDGRAWIE